MVMCNLHIIHKAFQYGCIEYGSKLESIINLYGWFKVRPYKREDIHAVSMELGEANPLFQCHLEIHCKAALQSSKRISYEFSTKTERSIQMLQIYGQISQPLNSVYQCRMHFWLLFMCLSTNFWLHFKDMDHKVIECSLS